MNWTRIHGSHRADEAAHLIRLGNFRSKSNTQFWSSLAGTPFQTHHYIDDVAVYEFNPLPPDTVLCVGESLDFDATFLDATYNWSDGTQTATHTLSEPGLYYVEAIIDDVVLRDSIRIISGDLEDIRFDTLLCDDGSLTLDPGLYGNYVWNTDATTPSITVTESGVYRADISNECTFAVYEADITIDDCSCDVYIPNAFSPNYDGTNDYFEPTLSCLGDYSGTLEIFDRYGGLMFQQDFETFDRVRWRAEDNFGVGVYVYKLTVDSGGRIRTYAGSVTLLR